MYNDNIELIFESVENQTNSKFNELKSLLKMSIYKKIKFSLTLI
jgi:hypothetical protein